jgi:FkbM family methyltransferase
MNQEELLKPENLFRLIDELNIPEIYKLRSLQNFMSKYNINPKVIFDLGARDLYESMWFSVKYPNSQVHSFECNPDMLDLCKLRASYFPNINFNAKAVTDNNGTIDFFKIDQEATKSQPNLPYYIQKDGNPGASSIYVSKDQTYKQQKVTVESTRLDSYMSENDVQVVDLMWIDIQGAEKIALESMSMYLRYVKMIHLEMPVGPNTEYYNAATFTELDTFLQMNNFEVVGKGQMDYIYINKDLLAKP